MQTFSLTPPELSDLLFLSGADILNHQRTWQRDDRFVKLHLSEVNGPVRDVTSCTGVWMAWARGSSRPCDSSELLQVFSSVFIKRLPTSSPHMDAVQLYSSTGFHFKSSFEGWRHHNVWSGSSDLEPSWNCSRLLPEFGQSVNQIKLHMVQKTAKKGSEGCWKIPSVIKVMKTFSCCRLTSVRFSRSNFLRAD